MRWLFLRVRIPPPTPRASTPNTAEGTGSEPVQSRFESEEAHQPSFRLSCTIGRCNRLKSGQVWVRIPGGPPGRRKLKTRSAGLQSRSYPVGVRGGAPTRRARAHGSPTGPENQRSQKDGRSSRLPSAIQSPLSLLKISANFLVAFCVSITYTRMAVRLTIHFATKPRGTQVMRANAEDRAGP